MKIYRFRAGSPRDDMIMGLSYPATFMIPALVILLFLEALFPNVNITHLATLNIFVMPVILVPAFIVGRVLATKIKSRLGRDFKVQINDREVIVWMDDKNTFTDFFEEVIVEEDRKALKLKIYGVAKDIVFIGREKGNSFGFCTERDLSEMRKLAAYLQGLSVKDLKKSID